MKVPVSNVVQMPQAQGPKIDPTMLAMAASLMHQEGKFTVTRNDSNQPIPRLSNPDVEIEMQHMLQQRKPEDVEKQKVPTS